MAALTAPVTSSITPIDVLATATYRVRWSPSAMSTTYALRATRTPTWIRLMRKYATVSTQPTVSVSRSETRATTARTTSDAAAAPAVSTHLLDRSASRPNTRPPRTEARPCAITNAPSPLRSPVSLRAESVTRNGGVRAETSRRARTVTKRRNGASSASRARASRHQDVPSLPFGPSGAGSSIPAYSTTPANHVRAAPARKAARTPGGTSGPIARSARPTAIATTPETAVEAPVIWPR